MSDHFQSPQQNLPRVLLCAADVGCGHGRAAAAVMMAMRRAYPLLRPTIIDALAHAPNWFNHVYRDLYVAAAKHFPRLNGWLYNSTDLPGTPVERGVAAAIETQAMHEFCRLDSIQQADLIVCTHFLCARVLSRLRGSGQLRAKLAVVITDQHPHAVWRVPHGDLFMVASDIAAEEMARNGIDPTRVVVTGIPIDWRFARPMSRDRARAKLGLPCDKPVILLTGGGLGLGGLDLALEGILASPGEHYTLVVCGMNRPLQEKLSKRIAGKLSKCCQILGITTKMHELMAAADVMVGKPGGLSTAEAAARGLPMVLLQPIPGQEERNAQIMVQSGAAMRQDDPYEAGKAAADLVQQPGAIELMHCRARLLGRPDSARAAADAALALCPIQSSSRLRSLHPFFH